MYGASGSVGTFALQIAKSYGAEVTAVSSSSNANLVGQLGAQKVIDYKKEDFTKTTTRFDVIFDAVGKIKKSTGKHLIKPGGKFVTVARPPKSNPDDLLVLKDLIERGN